MKRWVVGCVVGLMISGVGLADGEGTADVFEVIASQPVTIGEESVVRSPILGYDAAMKIAVPSGIEVSSPEHTYPVVFVVGGHGREFFSTVAGVVKHLADRERMPESLVVSLEGLGDIPPIHTHGMWQAEMLDFGGDPPAAIRHLEDEVVPYLKAHYRANEYRIVVGVSGSALWPLHVFTAAPELFESYVLVAAADVIGMGYTAEETFIDAFEAAFETSPDRRVKLYLGTAESDLEKRPEYQDNLDDMQARLGRFDGLDLRIETVPRDDHYAVLLKALPSALEQNFPHEQWSARYRDLVAQDGDALENIDRYYRELSARYGFTILPRADRWNNVNSLRFMVRHLIGEERPAEALAAAYRMVEYRPGAPSAHAWLATALEANGQHDAAVAAQRAAVALAEAHGSDEVSRFSERLGELVAGEDAAREEN
ncbi:MAG: alpha/beta hydrolase-fold protein [Acidobacteriota bacterium]